MIYQEAQVMRKPIEILVLAMFAVCLLFNWGVTAENDKAGAAKVVESSPAKEEMSSDSDKAEEKTQIVLDFSYEEKNRRDPMVFPWNVKSKNPLGRMDGEFVEKPKPPVVAVEKVVKIELPKSIVEGFNGIVYQNNNSLILISGRILEKGEKILGATLVDINKNEAVFDYKDRKFVLRQVGP
jgi:hypothetical protein